MPSLPFSWMQSPVISFRSATDGAESRHPVQLWLGVVPLAAIVAVSVGTAAEAQTATEVQVTPETMTLSVGQRQPIFAAAYDRKGNLIASAKFTFWSSDTSIARVSREGTVQGVTPGLSKVEARVQGKRASLAVLITAGAGPQDAGAAAGTVLTLDPATAVLLPGESVAVTPQGLRADGTAAPLGRVIWKSLKPEVANVDSSGVVLGMAAGRSIVQATTATGLMATVPIEVESAEIALVDGTQSLGPEEAETLQVTVPSQGNRRLTRMLQWRSTDTAVATVGQDGIVTARGAGRAEIAVHAFGQERRLPLVVHRLAQTLVVSPKPSAEPIQMTIRGTRSFTTVAQAADSTPVPEARVVWEVADTSRAAFNRATGVLSALDTGQTTITALVRGFEPVVWRVQVVPGVLDLDRARAGLRPGEQVTIAARLLDDAGKVIGPATVEWISDHPDVATVIGGQVRGLRPGHAVVSARSQWGRVSADVYVTADLLVVSNRGGVPGVYQLRSEAPDSLLPLLADSSANVQAVRSPDRTRVAFSSSRNGSYDLFVMDADGRNRRRLTADPGVEGEPAWTPDGARLVYTAAPRDSLPQLVNVRADGNDARAITASAGGNRSPDVSPDGRRVAFVSTRDGNPEIYEIDLAGGDARRITKTSGRESSPRYLPSGDLLFVVDRGSRARLMRLPAGGAVATPVMDIDQPVQGLDVSGDGGRLVYVAGRLAEPGKGKSQLSLRVQTLAPGSKPVLLPLRPGEQVQSPSF